jgi:hypothetical protein
MKPPPTDDPEELLKAAETTLAAAATLQPGLKSELGRATKSAIAITVIVFPDEATYQGADLGIGCLFLVSRKKGKNKSERPKVSLIRGEAISDEMFARVPASAALRNKRVLLIGCGAIGSFIALELARLGVGKLTMWDPDIVRPGNSVRWPLGRTVWGVSKTLSLTAFLARNYPWTLVRGMRGQVGGTTFDPVDVLSTSQNHFLLLRDQIKEVDLVIDATGSTEAQQALSFIARDVGVPYLLGYSTLGAAGGVVAAFPSDAPSCLVCLLEHWNHGTLPEPPVDEDGIVAAGGCNSSTFTGASFDLQEVSLQVVRTATAILASDEAEKLASLHLLEMRDKEGQRILPRWSWHQIPQHEGCCGS